MPGIRVLLVIYHCTNVLKFKLILAIEKLQSFCVDHQFESQQMEVIHLSEHELEMKKVGLCLHRSAAVISYFTFFSLKFVLKHWLVSSQQQLSNK